jgi:hypothetical protein
MVLLLQASLLVQHAPTAVSEAFIATRLRQSEGTYGVVDLGAQDVETILDRARVGPDRPPQLGPGGARSGDPETGMKRTIGSRRDAPTGIPGPVVGQR